MKARLAVDVWRLVVGGRPEGPEEILLLREIRDAVKRP